MNTFIRQLGSKVRKQKGRGQKIYTCTARNNKNTEMKLLACTTYKNQPYVTSICNKIRKIITYYTSTAFKMIIL